MWICCASTTDRCFAIEVGKVWVTVWIPLSSRGKGTSSDGVFWGCKGSSGVVGIPPVPVTVKVLDRWGPFGKHRRSTDRLVQCSEQVGRLLECASPGT